MADDPIRRDGGKPSSHPLGSDEADLEHFFRSGDEGTYDGGPSVSLPPVYSELEDTESPSPEAIEQRLERRARYQQLVTRLISVLGVAALLALTLRATATGATEPESQPAARSTDPRLALAPHAAPAPESALAPAPEYIPAPESAPAPALESAPAPIEPSRAPAPSEAPRHSDPDRSLRARSPVRASSRAAAVAPAPVPAPRTAVLPRASAQFPSPGSSHAPPTANFPD